MAIRVGINGFGRIGRAVLRLTYGDPDIEVVMVNDLSPPETLVHLLKYDTVHGRFPGRVEVKNQGILFEGREIAVASGQQPKEINWSQAKVDIVLECTGRFRDREHCAHHIANGPKKVIVSAPGKGSDLTMVMGVNESSYKPAEHHVVSNASCTTNCLAPLAKVLDARLGIVHGYMTTIHSYTNDQRLLCGAHGDLRRARAGGLNQIPSTTGAARAIGLVLPKLEGKLEGMSIRVPTPNVSLVDLIVEVQKDASIKDVNGFFEEESKGPLKKYLDVSYEPLVSSDYNGSKYSAVVDGLSTNVVGKRLVKVLAWYDNETAFSQRMIDLAKYVGKSLG
jgi:glyceraldehyde 3-phosphate dehydrogenase